eukprot:5644598-Amphidinium_carterae.1
MRCNIPLMQFGLRVKYVVHLVKNSLKSMSNDVEVHEVEGGLVHHASAVGGSSRLGPTGGV